MDENKDDNKAPKNMPSDWSMVVVFAMLCGTFCFTLWMVVGR